MQTILITGGAGFIGSNFVRSTLANRENVEVTVLDALTYAADERTLEGVDGRLTVVHGDIADSELVDTLVADTDLVVPVGASSAVVAVTRGALGQRGREWAAWTGQADG